MALLKREEWQGFVRDVDWTYRYVDDDAVFPEWHSGTGKVPREAWLTWEEDYKVTYPEYVATQRDKEASAYAVKAALQRSTTFDHLDEGWKSATKMHFGGVALVEYAAVLGELKMARFGSLPPGATWPPSVSSTRCATHRSRRSSATSSSARTPSTTGRRRPSTPTTGCRSRYATCSTT